MRDKSIFRPRARRGEIRIDGPAAWITHHACQRDRGHWNARADRDDARLFDARRLGSVRTERGIAGMLPAPKRDEHFVGLGRQPYDRALADRDFVATGVDRVTGRDDDASLVVSVGDGGGAYAVEVWGD